MFGIGSGKRYGVWRYGYWGVIALVGLLLMSACRPGDQVAQDPLLRSLERKSGLLVYVGTDGNIYTIDQGGGKQTPITKDSGNVEGKNSAYQLPTWSPDSQRLAFVKVTRNSRGSVEAAHVYTSAPDGTGLVEAYTSTTAFPIYLYWSPDSQHLSFLTSSASGQMLLQMVPAQGSEVKVLDTGAPFYWAWSPNSQTLLVHVGGAAKTQPQARLAFLSLADEVLEEGLTLRPATFQAPAWSPDGNQLLLAAETEAGEPSLLLTDPRGAVKSVLTQVTGSVAFAWSPDSHQVAYIATDTARQVSLGKLTVLDPEKPAEGKTIDQEDIVAFFWSPDSRQIAYFVPILYSPTPEPNQTEATEPILLLQLHVLDTRSGESREVTTFLPTQEFLGVLPYFDQYQQSTTLWSPDSKNLALSGYPVGNATRELGIWVIAASGSLEPRFLTEGTLAFWSRQ